MTSQLEAKIADWDRRRYSGVPPNIERTMIKIVEEVGEVAKGLLKNDIDNVLEELADVGILLIRMSRALGSCLEIQIERKLVILEQRLKEGKKR